MRCSTRSCPHTFGHVVHEVQMYPVFRPELFYKNVSVSVRSTVLPSTPPTSISPPTFLSPCLPLPGNSVWSSAHWVSAVWERKHFLWLPRLAKTPVPLPICSHPGWHRRLRAKRQKEKMEEHYFPSAIMRLSNIACILKRVSGLSHSQHHALQTKLRAKLKGSQRTYAEWLSWTQSGKGHRSKGQNGLDWKHKLT